MDVLSDILQHICLDSALVARPRTFAPWGLAMAAGEEAAFHVILGGAAFLRVQGLEAPVELRPGDFVLLPHGHAHSLADAPDSAVEPLEPLLAERSAEEVAALRVGGDGRETLAVCGRFRFARRGVHPLLSQLPPLIHVRAGEGWRGTWLEHGVHLLSVELASERPGSREMVARLLEVLFLQALRCYVEEASNGGGSWLQGLRDERVAAALGCIHAEPATAWTAGRLAERLGMSRAAFAPLFQRLVGEAPVQYLTRWRIQLALHALHGPRPALSEIAASVGYPSTAAFTRIFKRLVGMPPAEYRRAAANGGAPLLERERAPLRAVGG